MIKQFPLIKIYYCFTGGSPCILRQMVHLFRRTFLGVIPSLSRRGPTHKLILNGRSYMLNPLNPFIPLNVSVVAATF